MGATNYYLCGTSKLLRRVVLYGDKHMLLRCSVSHAQCALTIIKMIERGEHAAEAIGVLVPQFLITSVRKS